MSIVLGWQTMNKCNYFVSWYTLSVLEFCFKSKIRPSFKLKKNGSFCILNTQLDTKLDRESLISIYQDRMLTYWNSQIASNALLSYPEAPILFLWSWMKELTHYRLAIVGVTIDNEELLHIILRGLPSITIAIILWRNPCTPELIRAITERHIKCLLTILDGYGCNIHRMKTKGELFYTIKLDHRIE